MARARGYVRFSFLTLIALVVLVGPLLVGVELRQPDAHAAGCWTAAITKQWTDLGLAGSVLRVSVQGKSGLPVVVRTRGDFQAIGYTGTKPEYGPNVAEFAPLSRGTYFIEPEGLGIVFEVWLDGLNYTRVEFTALPCAPTPTFTPRPPTATAALQATAIPTRQPPVATAIPTRQPPAATAMPTPPPPVPVQPAQSVVRWQGRIAQHLKNPGGGVYWATIAVRVIGRPAGQQVEIRSDGWSTIEKTGTKTEHGPDACEFGALNNGTYRLTPLNLGTSLEVAVERGDFVLVEFHQTGGGASNVRWVGSVVQNTSASQSTAHANSAIAVVVAGKPWHEVEIRTDGWSTTAQTGYKPEYGPDACEFGGLRAANYAITPKGLGATVEVTMDGWGWAMVRFDPVNVPAPQSTSPPAQPSAQPTQPAQPTQSPAADATPTPTSLPNPTPAGPRWQGWVVSNSSGEQQGTGIWSVIVVRVLNYPGVPVTVTGGGDWSATCITGTKPEYGPDACEFGGLWPATYYLRPQGSDVQAEVTMDGLGVALVEFSAR